MSEQKNDFIPDDPSQFYIANEVNILVIDDEQAICEVITRALEQPHLKISTVSKADEIETVLQNKEFSLIILDYVIPGMESPKLFELLRKYQPDSNLIVVTGFPSMDSALDSLRARAFDYLAKPFPIDKLRETVHRCLETRGLLRISETALKENLGKCIRDRRKGLGLTLAQMSARTKVSLGYLSQIELGKNSASIETLYRISLGLGIKLSELFTLIRA